MHGWDIADPMTHRLLLRQAALNSVLRQAVPGLSARVFATPLDHLNDVIPATLINEIYHTVLQSACGSFNPWGELYSALVPQPQRRQIGQFWTEEHVAEWMAAWLLQDRPRCLSDVGCGAGNFLIKAAQLSGSCADAPALYGLDISPLLLNLTQAAFLTFADGGHFHLPNLNAQNYLESPLPSNTDAVICNPPYTPMALRFGLSLQLDAGLFAGLGARTFEIWIGHRAPAHGAWFDAPVRALRQTTPGETLQ